MSNLYEILQDAQGGRALDNLAKQFNISTEEADAAVRELLPALSTGFLNKASEPAALGPIIGALGEGQHLAAFADPAAAQSPATAQKGDEVLAHLFGSSQANEQIILRASAATGLEPNLFAQMLPVIASMILGGVTKSLQGQGFGGIFTQLVNAASQGGLGSILGQFTERGQSSSSPQPQPGVAPSAPSADGLGGLGSILGQLLRGGQSSANPSQAGSGLEPSAAPAGGLGGILGTLIGNLLGRPSAPQVAPGTTPHPQGLDASAIQAALEALTKILQPGTPAPAGRTFGAEETGPQETQSQGVEQEKTGQEDAQSHAVQPQELGPPPEIREEIGEILDGKRH